MEYYLSRWFGEGAAFILGAIYILIVMFLPYGIVGTWRLRRLDIAAGRQRLLSYFTGRQKETPDKGKL